LANNSAVAATSKAILGLIEASCPRSQLINPQFALYHASSFDAPMAEGFSLYLYRIGPNLPNRNVAGRRTPDDRLHPRPLPVDLNYMITPWAADPVRQQRLLAWVMRFFEDDPVVPSAVLNHYLDESNVFRADEAIEVLSDPLAIQDLLGLWDKLKPRMQTSLTYVVRMVMLDSDLDATDRPRVQTRQADLGQLVTP